MAVMVEITPEAQAQVERLSEPMHGRVLAVAQRLHSWPAVSGVKQLRGRLTGHYRIRTGDYRVQFHVQGKVVIIEKVGHRDGFYED